MHGLVRRRGQRHLSWALAGRVFERLLNQAVPVHEPGAVVLQRTKLANRVAPGRGS
jgi:hypothetical protein